MLFSVDAHALGCHLTGNEVYVRNLLQGFAARREECEFLAYYSAEGAQELVPQSFATCRVARNPFVRLGLDLPRRLRQHRPALLHVQYTMPLACPVPVVVSVHDISFVERPEFFSTARALQLGRTVASTIRKAAKVLTGSDFAGQSILRAFPEAADKLEVIPNAADPRFRPVERAHAVAYVEARYGIAEPFVLTVGDLQPRKNQAGLVRAFAALARNFPQLPHRLVIAGKDKWQGSQVMKAIRAAGIQDRVHLPGFVSDEDLLYLYNACDLFVFPSFYEGFGLPVLEAMACNRAVACSKASALPEVADGAAIFFDPHRPDEITRALRDLLLDSELRARMERLGSQRAAHFSWEKTARRTLEVYNEVGRVSREPNLQSRATSMSHS